MITYTQFYLNPFFAITLLTLFIWAVLTIAHAINPPNKVLKDKVIETCISLVILGIAVIFLLLSLKIGGVLYWKNILEVIMTVFFTILQ